MWKMVTCDQDFLLSQSLPETKVAPPDHSGHWELWYTYDEETEDVHPHMLMTHWFQGGNHLRPMGQESAPLQAAHQ